MRRVVAWVAVAVVAAGCKHTGTLATRGSSQIILGRSGIPEFPGSVNKCPGSNGEGEILRTWDNGQKRVKGTCRGGLMVGEWKAFYENGALEWEAQIDGAGQLTGTFKSFYANDQKRAVVGFKEGFPAGEFKGWHFNGAVSAKGDYAGGKRNGCWETWHDNGQKESKGTYENGTQVVTWLYWTPTGEKRKEKLGGTPTHGECLLTL